MPVFADSIEARVGHAAPAPDTHVVLLKASMARVPFNRICTDCEHMDLTRFLLESLPEPHLILSRELNCLAVNEPFAQLISMEVDSLIGSASGVFWPDANRFCEASGEYTVAFTGAEGKAITARIACLCSDVVVVRVLASVAAGETARLHHKQRIETLGLLASGVAHDFNNVLTGILGHVAFLKHVLSSNDRAEESLQAIEEGALRASGLTQQILTFSKLDSGGQSTRVDVADLIGRIASLLKSAIPAAISLRVPSTSVRFPVLASEAHVTQIVINLIINARDAISGEGIIDVALDPDCSLASVSHLFGGEPPAAQYGAIVVTDTGMGMTDEVRARLFEPYFTTKNAAGTGLGLATVQSIVRALGGAIEVISQINHGTTFRIVLPLVSEESSSEASGFDQDVVRGKGERILVIDDEDAVRNVLGLSLSHLGYQVDTAASGLEGVEQFERASESYQVVILDLLMPGLSGEEVFHRLSLIRPGVPVLIVSGFSSEHVVQRLLEDGARDFIQKPFSIEVLSEKVRGCISG